MRERITNACQAFWAETQHLLEPAVVRGSLYIFERFDSEIVLETVRQLASDTRNRGEELRGFAFAAQSLEHRQPTTSE